MAGINIQGRDQGSVKLLKDLAASAKILQNEMVGLKGSLVEFNIDGQKTTATLRGLNKQGQDVTATIKGLQGQTTKFTLAIKDNEQAIKKQTEAIARQKKEEQELAKSIKASVDAQNLRRTIQRGFSRQQVLSQQATPQEVFNLKQAEAAVTSLVRTQKISASQAKVIWNDVRQNIFRAFEGAKGDAQRALFNLVKAQRAVGTSAKAEMQKVRTAVKTATKATQEFTVSWASLGRIVTVQLLRRALFAFTNALRESVKEAIELSKRIAELQTISQNAQLTTEEWTTGLVKLSESFGLTILDTTEAAYQTLSNQVAEGAETLELLATAAKFSITTLTSATDSVNLLTAALNAYGKSTDEAEHVAATLFKTIELGRIRGSELANTLGRIAVLGNQLGVSLEGLEAFLAIVTIRGVKTSEAMTQIRGVFNKLLRPTEEMKKLFRELGVTSAEQLFQTRSLVEVFQELAIRTQGSSTELGKLFPRVRGITGAMIGAIASAGEFGEKLTEIKEGSEAFAIAQKLVLESSGKVVERELQKIKNFFTVTFGKEVIDTLASFNKNILSISASVKFLATAIGVGLLGASFKLVTVFGALALSNPFVLVIAGVALATAAIIELVKATERAELEAQAAVRKSIEARVKAAIDAENQRTRQFERQIDARTKLNERASRDIIGQLNKLADAETKIIKGLTKIIKSEFSETTNALKAGLKELSDEQRDIVKEFESLSKFEVDIGETIRDQIFDNSLDRLDNIGDKLLLFQKEIDDTEKRIAAAVISGDSTLFQAAITDLNKLTNERIRLARDVQKDREKLAIDIVEKEAKLALDLNKLREQGDAALAVRNLKRAISLKIKERNLELVRTREIEKLRERLADSQNRDVDKFADNFEKQFNRILQITKAGTEQIQAGQLKRALEIAQKESNFRILLDRQEEAQKRFVRFDPKALEEAETPEALRKIFQERLSNINALLTITKELEGVQSSSAQQKRLINLESIKEATLAQQISVTNSKNLDFAAKERKESEAQLKALREEVVERRKLLLTQVETAKGLAASLGPLTPNILADLLTTADLERLTLTPDDIAFIRIIDSLGKTFTAFGETGALKDVDAIAETITKLQSFNEEREGLAQFNIADAFIRSSVELNNLLSGFNPLRENIGAATIELFDTNTAIETIDASVEDVTKEIKRQNAELNKQPSIYERINVAIRHANESLAAEFILRQAVTPAFARGGAVSSSDTISALLSPGEFVVNAKAARRFHSQLIGINSGMARGGTVSQTTVGDIHIHGFQSSGSPDTDVVRLGKRLRRQVRRGTVKLS